MGAEFSAGGFEAVAVGGGEVVLEVLGCEVRDVFAGVGAGEGEGVEGHDWGDWGMERW